MLDCAVQRKFILMVGSGSQQSLQADCSQALPATGMVMAVFADSLARTAGLRRECQHYGQQ